MNMVSITWLSPWVRNGFGLCGIYEILGDSDFGGGVGPCGVAFRVSAFSSFSSSSVRSCISVMSWFSCDKFGCSWGKCDCCVFVSVLFCFNCLPWVCNNFLIGVIWLVIWLTFWVSFLVGFVGVSGVGSFVLLLFSFEYFDSSCLSDWFKFCFGVLVGDTWMWLISCTSLELIWGVCDCVFVSFLRYFCFDFLFDELLGNGGNFVCVWE